MDQDSDRLLSVAGPIVEGSAVSWDDEQRQASDEESGATLRGLQDLEVILAAQRVIEREYETTTKRRRGACGRRRAFTLAAPRHPQQDRRRVVRHRLPRLRQPAGG